MNEELFLDFKIKSCADIFKQIEVIHYYQRPQSTLNYITPIKFKHLYYNKED